MNQHTVVATRGLPRALEAVVAGAALLLLSPLLLVTAALVKMTSAGPVLFRQERVGRGGQPFTLLKFRTMVSDAEGFESTLRHGSRTTWIGRSLRKYKLDEFPEFWNVVCGEMSLVGPRPEVPELVDPGDPLWVEVLSARPGLTDPVTLRLRDEERILASAEDRESYYRHHLQPYKLRGYRDYLRVRTWETDVSILWQTTLGVIAPKRVRPPSEAKLVRRDRSQAARPTIVPIASPDGLALAPRRLAVVALHLGIIALSNYLAFWLRFDGAIPARELALWSHTVMALVALRATAFLLLRFYEGSWRYVGVTDLRNIALGAGSSSVAFYVLVGLILGLQEYPRSVHLIDLFLAACMTAGMVLARPLYRQASRPSSGKRVLIVGAGDVGEMLVRDLRLHSAVSYQPIGFVDDEPRRTGERIHGVPVLGTCQDLPRIMVEEEPDEVIVALSQAGAEALRSTLSALQGFDVPIKTLPSFRDMLGGKASIQNMRDLSPEDLLNRPPVQLDPAPLRRLVAGRCVLVTGAGGSIGSELCRQVAEFGPSTLVLFERAENSLYRVANDLEDRGVKGVRAVIGDVTDEARVDAVLDEFSPDILFHAAAHKHVPLMEHNPCEAVKNNVRGTRILKEAAERHGVERFVLISSDKAVRPTSVMGATKRVAELVVQDTSSGNGASFFAVRFGNVLASDGSVVPRFLQQIRAGGPVTVTHPEMRRYFMLIPEAVQLVLQAAAQGKAGAVYVLEMGEQIRILDLARNLIRLAGLVPSQDVAIDFTGLRPGEKLYEELVADDETARPAAVEQVMEVQPARPWRRDELARLVADLEAVALRGQRTDVLKALCRVVPSFSPDGLDPAALGEPTVPRVQIERRTRTRERRTTPFLITPMSVPESGQ